MNLFIFIVIDKILFGSLNIPQLIVVLPKAKQKYVKFTRNFTENTKSKQVCYKISNIVENSSTFLSEMVAPQSEIIFFRIHLSFYNQ